MQKSDSAALMTMADLKARGWNQRLVFRFLGEPDSHSNPGFQAGRPARLYCAERVRQVETGQPDFAVAREFSRQAAGRRCAISQRKQRSLLELAQSIELQPLPMTYAALLACVCHATPGYESAAERSLALRYLLGTMKLLEGPLELYSWNSGVCEARLLFRNRVLDHILKRYHLLADIASLERRALHGERYQDW